MSTQDSTDTVPVPEMVTRALDRIQHAWVRANAVRIDSHAARARQLGRIAELYEREARWWSVLVDWTYIHSDLWRAYGRAAIAAQDTAEDRARTHRDLEARAWQRSLDVASDSGVAA